MGLAERAAQAKAKAAEMNASAAEHKSLAAAYGKFEGVTLTPDTIAHGKTSGPTHGATARVELGSDIGKRVTAARLVAIGVFAFAAKKKTGHVFLTIEGDGFDIAVEVPAKKEADARQFAAKVNTAAKR